MNSFKNVYESGIKIKNYNLNDFCNKTFLNLYFENNFFSIIDLLSYAEGIFSLKKKCVSVQCVSWQR